MNKLTLVSLALATATVGACVDATDDVSTSEPGNVERITQNSLSPAQFVTGVPSTQLTPSSVATQISTANGRTTFSYMIGCALTSAQTVSYVVGTTRYNFTGEIGIAPTWLTYSGGMISTLAAEVSACVIGRMNLTGLVVNISGRGANQQWITQGTETTVYHLDEGTFWGNIFPNLGAVGPNAMFACMGADKAATPTQDDLANRHCTEDDNRGDGKTACGLVNAGLCSNVCTWDGTGAFRECTPPGGTLNPFGVTVFVQ